MKVLQIALLASVFILQGCGSNDDPTTSVASALTGVFLDSPVGNINYKTETKSGVTDSDGKYEYVAGETVTFSIGSLTFPPVAAAETVTPLDIAGTTDPNNPKAVNMLRLLQTLDADGDPSNGITITEAAKGAATQVDFADSEAEFASSVDSLLNANADATGGDRTLVSATEAVAHFEETLVDSGVTFNSLTGSWQLTEVNEEDAEGVIFHFFPDGRFIALQWQETNDFNGFEYGTYQASDGKITFVTLENQDGEALTCNKSRGVTCNGNGVDGDESSVWEYSFVDQNQLNLETYDTSGIVFSRIAATDSPVDGLWESRGETEVVHFAGGSAAGTGNYFYVKYASEDANDPIEYEIGNYNTVVNDGNSVINFTPDGDDTEGYGYSVINQQLAIIDPQDSRRGYFDLVFAEDEAPANTAKLLAQKQYEADKAAFDNYGVEINDDYRTEIRTPDTYISQGTTESASSVGAKITIDADSTLTRSGEDSGTSLRTRLQAVYGYPGNESRAHGLYVEVALQLRNNGGAAQARYAVSTCFTPECSSEDEIYLNGTVSDLGSFNSDRTLNINWDNTAQAFAFLVDGEEVGRVAMSDYNNDALAVAAGGYTFDPSDYTGTRITADIYDVESAGDSGYLVVHVDEVSVDGEVYDDFTAGRIDASKWKYRAYER